MKRFTLVLILLAATAAVIFSQRHTAVVTARRLGLAYYEESKYQASAEQFRKVVRENPRSATFADHLNLGLALMSVPDEAGALSELESARQLKPSSPEVLYSLAILNKRQGRLQAAVDNFRALEGTGHADMATYFNLGAVLTAMNKPEEALAAFQKVLDLGYDFGPSWFLATEFRMSRLLARLGRSDQAAKMFSDWEKRRKLVKEPNDSPTTLELGPLAKPQIPPDNMVPPPSVVVPVFAEQKEGAPALAPAKLPTVHFDYDVDGDVDELSIPNKCGALRLRRNNGNGTFVDVTAHAGLAIPGGKEACAISVADLDNDSDLDIIAAGPGGAWYFSNERGGKFKATPMFGKASGTEVAAVELSGDGRFDVAFGSRDGVSVWWSRTRQLTPLEGARAPFVAADLNGDGMLDLAAASDKGIGLWLNRGGQRFERHDGPAVSGALHSMESAYAQDASFWLLASAGGGALHSFVRKSPKTRWLRFEFDGVRSNKEGIGATVEVKSGNFYTRRLVGDRPLLVETAELPKVDVVRVTWPNGIVQNVIETATDKQVSVSEQDRLASSCPLLYLWDGRGFRFFAEVLSSTPLGEPDGHGGQILPGVRENVFLPGERMRPRDGRYVFQLTEELREAIYMDGAHLVAVDHPAGTHAFIDEAYRGAPLAAAPLAFDRLEPVAFEKRPAAPRQDRLPGLMEKHAVYFDLPEGSDFLVLRGWTYWMDSNIAVAASQDPARQAVPPRLEARQPDGTWQTVIEDVGMPAGAGRYVVADLRGRRPAGASHFRIVTNLRVFWQQIAAARGLSTPQTAFARPAAANLHFRGFSQPAISPTRSSPDFYDYSRLLKTAPWDPLPGAYTRYGDVRPLLGSADDRLVVFGAGDELTLEFEAAAFRPLHPGWKRDFVLELWGWAKAGETNTASSDSVEPIPYRAMKHYPYRAGSAPAWQREWLTRRPMPLLIPLAPAY